MAFSTALNDAQSISDSDIKAAFEKVQSKDSAGPITSGVLSAFVQFVALFLGDQGGADATSAAMANQVMDYLQGYDGANKRCTVYFVSGGDNASWNVAPSNGVYCGWQAGCFGGLNHTYGIMCQVTWD